MNLCCARLEIKWRLLLLFILLFLSSAYGSTVQNSVTTSKNFMISKILFWKINEWTSIKYVCTTFWIFIHLGTPSTLGYIFDDSFANNVRMLLSMPPYQIKDFKKIVLLFFLHENKSFVDFPHCLASQQSRQSWHPARAMCKSQCSWLNKFLSFSWRKFFTMNQPKTKPKNVL